VKEPQARRAVILASAAELFARKGVRATTVREIADAVGILSGSLYHHFESKDAIVDELLRSYLDDLRARYAKVTDQGLDPRSLFDGLVHASLETAAAHPYATEIYQNDFNLLREQPRFSYLKTAATEVQKTWLDAITQGKDAGVFRTDIAPRILYRVIRDVVWLSIRWYKPTAAYGIRQLADDCTSILLDGISTKPRRKSSAK
jgi:TetR/AcrR family transcriptional regulator, cholesterol catabolism regulator